MEVFSQPSELLFEQHFNEAKRLAMALHTLHKASQRAAAAFTEMSAALEAVSFAFRSTVAYEAAGPELKERTLTAQTNLRAYRDGPENSFLSEHMVAQIAAAKALALAAEEVEKVGKERHKAQYKCLTLRKKQKVEAATMAEAEAALAQCDERFVTLFDAMTRGNTGKMQELFDGYRSCTVAAMKSLYLTLSASTSVDVGDVPAAVKGGPSAAPIESIANGKEAPSL